MIPSCILISTLVMVEASQLQMEAYEEYYQSRIENTDQIVFYFHGGIYLNLLSNIQLSVRQLTISANFTTPIPNLILRYFNPRNVIISHVANLFLKETHAANNSIENLLWTFETLAIFLETDNSYRKLVFDCNKITRKVEFCKFYKRVVQ